MISPLLNRWVHTARVTLAPNTASGLAIDLGMTANPGTIRARIRTRGVGLLQAHEARLYENAPVSNTNDPARGSHLDRVTGDTLPPWLFSKLGISIDDIFIFHDPGTFSLGVLPAECVYKAVSGPLGTFFPEFELVDTGYHLVYVQNLETVEAVFEIEVEYEFLG